jgi:hypothetical protein
MGASPLQGPLERVGPENRDFLGPEMATHVYKITHTCVFVWRVDFMILMGENPLLGTFEGVGRPLNSLSNFETHIGARTKDK